MPHHRWSARGALRSGITRRWVRGNLLVTLMLLALIEGMFLYNTVRGYYDGVEQSMYQRFSSISGQLKVYGGDTARRTAARRRHRPADGREPQSGAAPDGGTVRRQGQI